MTSRRRESLDSRSDYYGTDTPVVDFENLEQETITSATVEELKWGSLAETSISNVKWGFEKQTASFRGADYDGNLGDVVQCRKTLNVVDFRPGVSE